MPYLNILRYIILNILRYCVFIHNILIFGSFPYLFVALKYIVYFKLYVCADSKRPSQKVFNPVGTELLIHGYNL